MYANHIYKANITKIKRRAYDEIKRKCFQHNGIIFGGFVRDEYISEYYSAKYNKHYNNSNRYWDIKHSPETNPRLLIAKDIDISFKSQESANNFIEAIKDIKEFYEVCVVDRTYNTDNYSNVQSVLASIKQVFIYLRVGHIPFVNNGFIISMSIDVVVPNNPLLQPPFNNLDVLCNGFIMTYENGKQFSRNTGTIIDNYSDYERAVIVPQILKDMFEFKTYICMTTNARNRFINIDALKRIKKLFDKNEKWTILNMPFKKEIYTQEEGCEKAECPICYDSIDNNQIVAYTTSIKETDGEEIPTNKIHYDCMMQHLDCQIHTVRNWTATSNEHIFTFKCPFRNNISFVRCKLDIQFAYKTDL
jgi:hypothetical protein